MLFVALIFIFLQDPSKKDELLKPTNPVAQKAMLAASSQLKVTGQPNYRIKPKPLQSIITGKVHNYNVLYLN